MIYTIAGVRYETAAGVIDAFAPDGDPPTTMEQVYELVASISDIAARDGVWFTEAEVSALVDAVREHYKMGW